MCLLDLQDIRVPQTSFLKARKTIIFSPDRVGAIVEDELTSVVGY